MRVRPPIAYRETDDRSAATLCRDATRIEYGRDRFSWTRLVVEWSATQQALEGIAGGCEQVDAAEGRRAEQQRVAERRVQEWIAEFLE